MVIHVTLPGVVQIFFSERVRLGLLFAAAGWGIGAVPDPASRRTEHPALPPALRIHSDRFYLGTLGYLTDPLPSSFFKNYIPPQYEPNETLVWPKSFFPNRKEPRNHLHLR